MIEKTARGWQKSLGKEISRNKLLYFLLFLVLALGFFFRVYRTDEILGFYYDQGRDGLVIWDFLHKGKLFLIGPTTGIEGIFRGPWYYWLIAPFYFFGGGDPVWPAVFLAFTTIVATILAYYFGTLISGRLTGFVAAVISAFSFFFIVGARWLSNPTPMFLISMLFVCSLFLIMTGKRWAWIAVGFFLGMAMQFGSAAEIFYFPVVLGFAVWLASRSGQRRNLPSLRVLVVALAAFVVAFLPQIVFDLKHDGVLSVAIKKFLFSGESFKLSFWEIVKVRSLFYFTTFSAKLFPTNSELREIFGWFLIPIFLINIKSLFRNSRFVLVLALLVTPMVGMFFFQGNYKNVYDYYFTGYYLIFVLVFSVILTSFGKREITKLLVGLFLVFFLFDNLSMVKKLIYTDVNRETSIVLGSQLQAITWVFNNSRGELFNVDVYVPPVIPWAYDYLFLWQANRRCGQNLCQMQMVEQAPLLYTLYEIDPPHPERLEAWLERQRGIGKVEDRIKFGGITVERRTRLVNVQE
ncbi:MAG: glycosyltransferase family 39 protein [Candidatus Blackburnbacteria bacterium]|nr:glycosyltransferase family 39 protein [Candidatus Blackburnbacteria bacterium]